MSDEAIKLLFTVLAGVLGIVAFLWNLFGYMWSYIFSHLQIDLTVEDIDSDDKNTLKITSIVENKGSVAKQIHFAFLLVYPSSSDYIIAIKEICESMGFKSDNATMVQLLFFLNSKKDSMRININNEVTLVAMPYFYKIHFQVGNERVKYPIVYDSTGLSIGEAYNVTFTIISLHLFENYLRYRSTTDLFCKQ